MICPTCDHENREDARFCDSCGQLLTNGDSSTATTSPPSSGSALAISFVSGRYGGKHLLGEVGKKRDYLAHDTLLDRDVAFALIETESLDDVGRARLWGDWATIPTSLPSSTFVTTRANPTRRGEECQQPVGSQDFGSSHITPQLTTLGCTM